MSERQGVGSVRLWIAGVSLAGALTAEASPPPSPVVPCECLATAKAALGEGSFRTPDRSEIESIATQLGRLDRILVRGLGEERLYLSGPRAVDRGLLYRSLTVREGFAYRTIEAERSESRLLPWSDIGSIHRSRGRAGRGAMLGAGLGLLVGIAIAQNQPCRPGFLPFGVSSNCPSVKLRPILGGLLLGAATGAVIGGRSDRWRQIYP